MNIELDEVVVQDVSDDALETAARGAQGGCLSLTTFACGIGYDALELAGLLVTH